MTQQIVDITISKERLTLVLLPGMEDTLQAIQTEYPYQCDSQLLLGIIEQQYNNGVIDMVDSDTLWDGAYASVVYDHTMMSSYRDIGVFGLVLDADRDDNGVLQSFKAAYYNADIIQHENGEHLIALLLREGEVTFTRW